MGDWGWPPILGPPLLYVNQNQHEKNMFLCSSPLSHKIIRAAYRKPMLRGGIFCGIYGQTLWTADNMDTVWLKIVAITKREIQIWWLGYHHWATATSYNSYWT